MERVKKISHEEVEKKNPSIKLNFGGKNVKQNIMFLIAILLVAQYFEALF